MQKQQSIKSQFSSVLFWDTNRSEADMETHAAFFVQRVLEYGDWNDWTLLLSYYGLPRIVAVCKQLRTLDPVCLSYICTISDTRKEDYRCWRLAQSLQTPWNS